MLVLHTPVQWPCWLQHNSRVSATKLVLQQSQQQAVLWLLDSWLQCCWPHLHRTMASIFTFDPDPPRLSSPWPSSIDSSEDLPKLLHNGDILHSSASLSDRGPSKLRPEPSYGPVEYKLHLLLRPRRQCKTILVSTSNHFTHITLFATKHTLETAPLTLSR